MTLEELRALRNSVKSDLVKRDSDGKSIQIIVGMGTCGIAAGAKVTFDEVLGMFMGNKSKNVNVYKKSEDKMNNFFNNK